MNLGEVFDLVNLNPIGPVDGELSDTEYKNVTSFILEVPIACLTEGNGDVIGAWTTARMPRAGRSARRRPSSRRQPTRPTTCRFRGSACRW